MNTKLSTYARAKKDPALAIAYAMERIETELEAKLEAKLMAKISDTFNPALLQESLRYMRGEDGYTPKKGSDYFTEEEKEELITYIQSQIRIPEDGEDADEQRIVDSVLKNITLPELPVFEAPQDGYTPQAGIDYPTEDQIKALISTEISYLFSIKPKDKGVTRDEINKMIGKIQQKIDWKAQAQEIARALETLKGKEKLDYNALKNLPEIPRGAKHTLHRGGGSSTGNAGTLQETTDLGSTTTNDIEITDTTKGVIIKSSNGTRFRIGTTDDGELTTTSL